MRAPTVLMYHAFGRRTAEQDPRDLFVDLDRLARQVRYLAGACNPLDLTGFLCALDRGQWSPRSVLVTIDDGFASTWQAAKVLARHRVPAVVFIPAGRVGGVSGWSSTTPDEPLLDADQLRALPELGLEVGVHGLDHVPLSGLPPDELDLHTRGAREVLADVLGRAPRAFAYPYGDVDDAAADAVRGAGYDVGFSVTVGDDRWRVQRRGISRNDTLPTFVLKTTAVLPHVSRAVRVARGHGAARASEPTS